MVLTLEPVWKLHAELPTDLENPLDRFSSPKALELIEECLGIGTIQAWRNDGYLSVQNKHNDALWLIPTAARVYTPHRDGYASTCITVSNSGIHPLDYYAQIGLFLRDAVIPEPPEEIEEAEAPPPYRFVDTDFWQFNVINVSHPAHTIRFENVPQTFEENTYRGLVFGGIPLEELANGWRELDWQQNDLYALFEQVIGVVEETGALVNSDHTVTWGMGRRNRLEEINFTVTGDDGVRYRFRLTSTT